MKEFFKDSWKEISLFIFISGGILSFNSKLVANQTDIQRLDEKINAKSEQSNQMKEDINQRLERIEKKIDYYFNSHEKQR